MSDNLFRLVYCSRNAIDGQRDNAPPEIETIVAASRRNNARDGVTGAMLYSDGCFAQVLEGGLADVQRTFERIQCDGRHKDVVVLQAGRADERLFGAWEMALANPANNIGASVMLGYALAQPGEEVGTTILALLDELVRRESEWAVAAE